MVSSLRYLIQTRPDISYLVGYMGRFIEVPTTKHLAAVKHILYYIADTIEYGYHYVKSTGRATLTGFGDSDMAGNLETHKSTTRVLFFLGSNPISWQSLGSSRVHWQSLGSSRVHGHGGRRPARESDRHVYFWWSWQALLLTDILTKPLGCIKSDTKSRGARYEASTK